MSTDTERESQPPASETQQVLVPEQYRKSAAPARQKTIIELKGVTKTFVRGKEPLTVLDGLTSTSHEGAFEALMGPSGSGKSTLLNLIAGLDRPTSGSAKVAGQRPRRR